MPGDTPQPPGGFVFADPQDRRSLAAETGYYHHVGMPVVLRVGPAIQFAEDGPFYKLALTFLCATAGMGPVFDSQKYPDFHADAHGVYQGKAREETRIDIPGVIAAARSGAITANDAGIQLCRMLAVAAWDAWHEYAVQTGRKGRGSVIQVFRFVRNAAAHGNRWCFDGGGPPKPVPWRHLVIDAKVLEGNLCFGGDLGPGDLLLLLMDVESTISVPGPKATLEAQAR